MEGGEGEAGDEGGGEEDEDEVEGEECWGDGL